MSYFSNGVIKAAKHRVKNTNSSKRYSWPFFVDPTWDVPLAKIPIFDPNSSYENISPEKEKFQIWIQCESFLVESQMTRNLFSDFCILYL